MPDTETAPVRATDSHDDHAAGQGHAAASEPLGPVDVMAWVYALVGGAIGVMVAIALLVARGV